MTDDTAPRGDLLPRFLPQLRSDRRVAAMLGLGFASGLPLLLVYTTLSAWLYDAGVPKQIITLLSEMALAYKLKFLWAPLLERFDPPLLGRLLGRRRAWILIAQAAVAGALCGIAAGDPAHRLPWTIAFGFALGFAGATQDVVIDGWRIAVAPEKKAVMSAWAEIGWRAGTFAGGAGALILADRIGWPGAYLAMAALVLPGMIAALLAPDPPAAEEAARSRASLANVLFDPMVDLVRRLGSGTVPILLLVAGFRMPGYVAAATATLLFKHLHYSNEDIAAVTKFWGVWVALGATFFAGWLVPRIGTGASLVIGTVFGSASHLALAWLAARGDDAGGNPGFWPFAVAVGIDGFAYAFASVVLITYMSTLCRSSMAAAQYALLTSLVALPGSLLAAPSGFIIEGVGFSRFFVGTALLGAPVAILAIWLWRGGGLARVAAVTEVTP